LPARFQAHQDKSAAVIDMRCQLTACSHALCATPRELTPASRKAVADMRLASGSSDGVS
jgi:hypothetical protein